MEIILNDYHKKVNAEMKAKVAYWQEHPQSRKESLRRLNLLREQRLARECKLQDLNSGATSKTIIMSKN